MFFFNPGLSRSSCIVTTRTKGQSAVATTGRFTEVFAEAFRKSEWTLRISPDKPLMRSALTRRHPRSVSKKQTLSDPKLFTGLRASPGSRALADLFQRAAVVLVLRWRDIMFQKRRCTEGREPRHFLNLWLLQKLNDEMKAASSLCINVSTFFFN